MLRLFSHSLITSSGGLFSLSSLQHALTRDQNKFGGTFGMQKVIEPLSPLDSFNCNVILSATLEETSHYKK